MLFIFYSSLAYMSSNDGTQSKDRGELPNIEGASLETRPHSITSSVPATDKATLPTQTSPVFLNFSFYKVDPKWRWLNELGKQEAAKEFASLIEVANTKMKVRVYSTLGLRDDSQLMLWMISGSVEKMQVLTSKIYLTIFGKYIESSKIYLSSYRPSVYSKRSKMTPGYLLDDNKKENEPMKYLIVYPFIKSREWYLLPFEDRMKMMDEHITVGRKFPQ
ncbi:MAG TPA: chlorite dismutase family protein, partial [Nitrososphaeraceae archaeon]|nr:chlorite dismutase family protein [Nitrososphaeraceae archaeon]